MCSRKAVWLRGGEGNDVIEIDASLSDTVQANGDGGDDIFILRGGKVNIDGGDGRDTLSANQRSIFAGIDVDLLAGTIKHSVTGNGFQAP
ncbi:MAG: hypothetical protein LV471_12060 [Nitrosomonas sp.]|nr:hypothetical protein [Nitrosomonas sp.]